MTTARTKRVAAFDSEAALCAAFIEEATKPDRWTGAGARWRAYPETGGFDIVMVRISDGVQIGIEAKLRLNEDVMRQAAEDHYSVLTPGPDYRAVLVPDGAGRESLGWVAPFLGLTVIRARTTDDGSLHYWPDLLTHDYVGNSHWHDNLPATRIRLPDYVPDVQAGKAAPVKLTPWKVAALKIAVLVEKRGFVTRADFKHVQIDHRRWVAMQWLTVEAERRVWVKGSHWPDFRGQHPVNFEQIAADIEAWKPGELALPAVQGGLL